MNRKLKENMFIRALAWPFENLKEKHLMKMYQNSEDAYFLRNLKDRHKGEHCFIIGNGPSLHPEDLDILNKNGEICFASNRIYYIYPKTNWRPTYYLATDFLVVSEEIDRIKQSGDYQKFLHFRSKAFGRKPEDKICYLCMKAGFNVDPYKPPKTLSSNVSQYVTKVSTVTVNAIELAIYMGFETIYLLGVDNSYAIKRLKDGTYYVDPSIKSSYFQGMKENERLRQTAQPVDFAGASYEVCKKFAEAQNVKIYNATRGGELEIFERVDFDLLFGETGLGKE